MKLTASVQRNVSLSKPHSSAVTISLFAVEGRVELIGRGSHEDERMGSGHRIALDGDIRIPLFVPAKFTQTFKL